jgi:coenzyme F420-0:L-glutamate ligase/coenzyme F420-1:gamma-L-glutamate ligase
MDRGILIVETRHGFICANAGVDTSNVEPETVTLLPIDPDESAREIREEIKSLSGVNLAVIISDTFGRPWREGLVSVALGVAGMDALLDYRGQPDGSGQLMQTTVIALADELASAAELVMGKNRRIPAALLRGVTFSDAEGSVKQLLRSPDNDLFR